MNTIVQNEARHCLSCGKNIRGRIDKKFCDDYCRNNYNNQLKAKGSQSPYVRNINNILLKNRKVLESLLSGVDDAVKTSRDRLLDVNFHFKYYTHQYTAKNGHTYFYCYEYGYMPIDNDWLLVVKKKEE